MRVWLIKIAEPMPFKREQLGRTGSLAEYLSKNGHEVIWWKSTYSHGDKKLYYNKHTQKKINSHEVVIFLHSSIIYKKNVSFQRILFYKKLTCEFKKYAEKKMRPDIILCAWPPASLANAAIEFGKKNHIPVVLDARDLWPDTFEPYFPWKTSKIFLYFLKKQAARLFSEAAGITAVQDHALRWACNYAGRTPAQFDRAINIGTRVNDLSERDKKECLSWWRGRGVTSCTWNMCFWGSLRNSGLDLDTCIKAVQRLEQKYPDIRLIIGGEGDSKKKLMEIAGGSKSIIFAGYLNGYQMETAMQICKVGVYSLINTEGFFDTISNKAIQYMSGGLPILNSLKGLTNQLITEYSAGLTYREGDVEDCAEKIERMYLNLEDRNSMAINAKCLFEEKFNSDKINKDFENYLCRIIAEYQRGNVK
jgi:glycosyltransferase involved in cell wall biosynthesis